MSGVGSLAEKACVGTLCTVERWRDLRGEMLPLLARHWYEVALNHAEVPLDKNTAQQQRLRSDLLQWGAAIKSGQPQIVADQLNARADAMENANGGRPTADSQPLRQLAKVAGINSTFALGKIQAMLAADPNGKDAADTLTISHARCAGVRSPAAIS